MSDVANMERAPGALRRYRVMAWVTGVMLLILVAEMLVKYVLQPGDEIGRAHV